MKHVVVLLCLIAPVAQAADFRTLNIGEPCSSVAELEAGMGSIPVPWSKLKEGEVFAFRTHEFDRDVVARYFCLNGNLFIGSYDFPLEPLGEAVETFHS